MARKISQDINTLLDEFGVEIVENHPTVESWLNTTINLLPEKENLLESCRQIFWQQGGEWNEEELKLKFLSF